MQGTIRFFDNDRHRGFVEIEDEGGGWRESVFCMAPI
jgi:hypothetical protein